LQQRGLVSYTVPKVADNDKWKLIYTIFYDNSLDVATFTSQRLEGKIDLRQQIGNAGTEPGTRPGPSSNTYRFDFRRVKASHFAQDFSPAQVALLSLPATVGGPGFTFIRDKRDNPLESTKGNYFTLDGFVAPSFLGSRSETTSEDTCLRTSHVRWLRTPLIRLSEARGDRAASSFLHVRQPSVWSSRSKIPKFCLQGPVRQTL